MEQSNRIKKKRKLFRGPTVPSPGLQTASPLRLPVYWPWNVGPSSLATYPVCAASTKRPVSATDAPREGHTRNQNRTSRTSRCKTGSDIVEFSCVSGSAKPRSKCCSHGNLLLFGLQGSRLNICYSNQDLHWGALDVDSHLTLHSSRPTLSYSLYSDCVPDELTTRSNPLTLPLNSSVATPNSQPNMHTHGKPHTHTPDRKPERDFETEEEEGRRPNRNQQGKGMYTGSGIL